MNNGFLYTDGAAYRMYFIVVIQTSDVILVITGRFFSSSQIFTLKIPHIPGKISRLRL